MRTTKKGARLSKEKEMGGWIFHRKIDWNNPTQSIKIENLTHPDVMQEWVGEI